MRDGLHVLDSEGAGTDGPPAPPETTPGIGETVGGRRCYRELSRISSSVMVSTLAESSV